MGELDLTEAIEAGVTAALAEYHLRLSAVTTTTGPVITTAYAKAAVRAAAPVIERAVREQVALKSAHNALDMAKSWFEAQRGLIEDDVEWAIEGIEEVREDLYEH